MKLIIYTRGNLEEGDPAVIMNTLEEVTSFWTETLDDIYIKCRCTDGRIETIIFDPEIDSLMMVE